MTCSKGAGMSPWALSLAMAGFAQKMPHFSEGRVFTKLNELLYFSWNTSRKLGRTPRAVLPLGEFPDRYLEVRMVDKPSRGRAAATDRLIAEMAKIAKEIKPCSVRALAYQLFNRKLIPSMALANTKKVSRLCVIAREEGTIPWNWIVDSTRQEDVVSTWSDPAAYARTVQRAYRKNKWESQPTHVSVWSEKATVEGTLRPVLKDYEVPFQILHGWSGATPVMDAVQANLRRQQATLILYVGDYDPSGLGMSEMDLPKRLARYSSDDPSDKDWSDEQIEDMLAQSSLGYGIY